MYKYKNLERVQNWNLCYNPEESKLPCIEAYVDGSYSPTLKRGGFGIYIIDTNKNEVIHKEFKDLDSKCIRIKSKNSLSSELNAVLRAMEIAKSLKLQEINIVYDCQAIISALWDTKVKNDEMYQFRLVMKKYLENIYVTFTHAIFYNHATHNHAHRLSRQYLTT